MDNRYICDTALQYENKALKKKIADFENGKRYLKIQEDHRRVIDGYIRETRRLKKELAAAHAETITVRNRCYDAWEEDIRNHRKEMAVKDRTIEKLQAKKWTLLRDFDDKIATLTREYEEKLAEKEAIIEKLKEELAHAEALLGRDSNNTSLPTGLTPPGKKKRIPNSRRNTGKAKGGQPGHERHVLEKPEACDAEEEVDHQIGEGEVCPTCGSENLIYTGQWEEKCEIDIEVSVVKRLHKYWIYRCGDCGTLVRTGIAPGLRAKCQYGAGVQALALSLMDTTNAAINKVPLLLSGITDGKVNPSEGYLAKLQKTAAGKLNEFMADLEDLLVTRPIIYWDDTVVMINKSRGCLRFYGDESIACYIAHDKKDMEGVLEDGLLTRLTKNTSVMHDHNSINYNDHFSFRNLECCAHILRDIQKSAGDTGHKILLEMKDKISKTIKERNDLKRKGIMEFSEEYRECFHKQMKQLLKEAGKLAEKNSSRYSGPDERALVSRLDRYYDNYFAWVDDFSLPVTNNLSERSLRGIKTKMKVSGQFASSATAGYYATIRSYIETCRRNGINEIEALVRLCKGKPYTICEIFKMSSSS